jgi:hypothetical protein
MHIIFWLEAVWEEPEIGYNNKLIFQKVVWRIWTRFNQYDPVFDPCVSYLWLVNLTIERIKWKPANDSNVKETRTIFFSVWRMNWMSLLHLFRRLYENKLGLSGKEPSGFINGKEFFSSWVTINSWKALQYFYCLLPSNRMFTKNKILFHCETTATKIKGASSQFFK